MKRIFIIVVFFISFWIFGQEISTSQILQASSKFFSHETEKFTSAQLQVNKSFSQDFPDLLFIENKTGKGFLVTPTILAAMPVVAYSFESSLEDMPPAVKWYFQWVQSQLSWLKEHNIPPAPINYQAWDLFLTKGKLEVYSSHTISPLLTTKWNQDCYYNELCPEHPDGPCGHCYAGCVATAMGQVMKFHAYPKEGQGSHMYGTDLYPNISANFEVEYLWDSMPSQLTSSNIPTATLLFHCGVSVNMDYTPNGSGSNLELATEALKSYFKYAEYATYLTRNNIGDAEWLDIVESELLARRPLIYAGCGNDGCHAFVVDGKNSSDRFHVNWGWGGTYDGYYYLSNLNPGTNFSSNQSMITGLEPAETDSVYCPSIQVYTALSDTIEDGSGPERYGNNTNCSWLIQPPGAGLIYIYFTKLATEKDVDIIEIRQGTNANAPLVATISGYDVPTQPILVWGPAAYIRFTSDEILRSDGFKLYYTSSMVNLHDYATEKIQVYPNPASHDFYVEIPNELLNNNLTIEIKNALQQTILSIRPTETKTLISLHESGVYYLHIQGPSFVTKKSLIVY